VIASEDQAIRLLPILEKARGVQHFRADLLTHLIGTWSLLGAWGAPAHVTMGGLAHSIYSTSIFPFAIQSVTEREEVKNLIGKKAENLAFLFGIMDRADAWSRIEGSNAIAARPYILRRDTKSWLRVSKRTLQGLVLIECANIADQATGEDGGPAPWMTQVTRWFERVDFKLPGIGELGLPNNINNERAAIAKYAMALCQPPRRAIKTLSEAIKLNTLAAEPWILRSLCAMEKGDRCGSLADARTGVRLLNMWCTPWDKRLGLSTWQEIASAAVEQATIEQGHRQKAIFATMKQAILR
jgi:Domain of unknown function (DUF6817)